MAAASIIGQIVCCIAALCALRHAKLRAGLAAFSLLAFVVTQVIMPTQMNIRVDLLLTIPLALLAFALLIVAGRAQSAPPAQLPRREPRRRRGNPPASDARTLGRSDVRTGAS